MKKFLLVLLVLSTLNINAQTEKGKFLLGGSSILDFKYQESTTELDFDQNKSKTVEVNFSPIMGYFIKDNLALGVAIPISFSNVYNDDFEDKVTRLSLTPFVKYYFSKSNLKPFLTAEINLGRTIFEDETQFSTDREVITDTFNNFGYNIGGGLAYFLNEKIALDLTISYTYLSSKAKDSNYNSFIKKFVIKGVNPVLGISIYL